MLRIFSPNKTEKWISVQDHELIAIIQRGDSTRLNETQRNSTRLNETQQDSIRRNETQ